MTKTNLAALIIVFSVFIFSCSKNAGSANNNTPKKPTGYSGDMPLFEGNNTLSASSLAGTTVTATNAAGTFNVTTDAKGHFSLPHIAKGGNITVTYSHDGFGEMKEYFTEGEYDSIQNGLLAKGMSVLYRISPVVVNSLTATLNGTELTLTCNVTAPNEDYAVRFAISKSSDVSYDNCRNNNNISGGFPVKNGDNIIKLCTPCEQQCGYKLGDTLYIKAYGDLFPLVSYYDQVNEKIVLPCVNTSSKSQVISFVVGK